MLTSAARGRPPRAGPKVRSGLGGLHGCLPRMTARMPSCRVVQAAATSAPACIQLSLHCIMLAGAKETGELLRQQEAAGGSQAGGA